MNIGRRLPDIPTWKLKHGKEELDELSRDEGMWSRGYGMNPIAPGERKFPSWPLVRKTGILLADILARKLPAYIGVDLSSKTRPGNAIVVVGLEVTTQRRYVLDVRYGNWSSPDTAKELADVCRGHNVQWIQVENNAYQESILDWIKASKVDFPYWMKLEPFTTGQNKADPQYGLPGLEVEFKNDSWIVPWEQYENHDPTCICSWCHLDAEFKDFPRAKTWDGVMALWFARDAINKWAPRAPTSRIPKNLRRR